MYKMSTKSKVGRISLLPVFSLLWIIWVLFSVTVFIFECLESKSAYALDKFQSMVDKYFPLDIHKNKPRT